MEEELKRIADALESLDKKEGTPDTLTGKREEEIAYDNGKKDLAFEINNKIGELLKSVLEIKNNPKYEKYNDGLFAIHNYLMGKRLLTREKNEEKMQEKAEQEKREEKAYERGKEFVIREMQKRIDKLKASYHEMRNNPLKSEYNKALFTLEDNLEGMRY